MSDILKSDRPIRGRNEPTSLIEEHEFSPVLGGPWLQLLRRTHLSGAALELLRRRIIVIPILAWGPLLILSSLEGHAWGATVKVPFLLDIELHLRLLLALPMLIGAELVVHQRPRPVVREFEEGGLISEASHDAFETAIRSAVRLRNSLIAEGILIAGVYLFGVLYVWPHFSALNVSTWYANPVGSGHRFSAAGWWFVLVSLPLFQFVVLRWYFRLFVWFRFLWQVARCKLSLVPTHPDRAGGLGFLSLPPIALAPFLAAQGVALAGMIADQIFFHGAKLLDFKVEVISVVAFLLFVVLGPLLLFAPQLLAMKRRGLLEYGNLAKRYVREFDAKWMRGSPSRRIASGKLRYPVARGSREQLRNHRGGKTGAHQGRYRGATNGVHRAAIDSAAADHDLARRVNKAAYGTTAVEVWRPRSRSLAEPCQHQGTPLPAGHCVSRAPLRVGTLRND